MLESTKTQAYFSAASFKNKGSSASRFNTGFNLTTAYVKLWDDRWEASGVHGDSRTTRMLMLRFSSICWWRALHSNMSNTYALRGQVGCNFSLPFSAIIITAHLAPCTPPAPCLGPGQGCLMSIIWCPSSSHMESGVCSLLDHPPLRNMTTLRHGSTPPFGVAAALWQLRG